jgi:hypothetical protein
VTGTSLVYVHGAGPQKPAPLLKRELDQLLFGHDLPTSRVAHYASVRWPPAAAGPAIGLDRSTRARRQRAIRAAAGPEVSAQSAARAIVTATLVPPGAGGRGVAAAGAVQPPADAVRLVARLYRNADRIALRSSTPRPGVALGPWFPDPIFRFIVGLFASDVVDYLFGGWADRMRVPVRQALLGGPPPGVIVAHSLGTIVVYDVLSEPAFAGLAADLLVTVGSPLGIANVQDRLRDGGGRPNPVPGKLRAWSNFADRWDPVALDATLRDEFRPPKNFARDEAVNNQARNNHDLTGYLSVAMVRSTILAAVGH